MCAQAAELHNENLSPQTYVDQADEIMKKLREAASNDPGKRLTTSKIRNLLSLVSDIYNTENRRTESELLEESKAKLLQMRIRMVYECGRDDIVKAFIEEAKLLQYLKAIQTREDLILFAHYMEALVAWHRYYGGK